MRDRVRMVRWLVVLIWCGGAAGLSPAAGLLPAADRTIPVQNAECEGSPSGVFPAGWTVTFSSAGSVSAADTLTPHGGRSSIMVRHPEPGQTTLASAPVRLEVGRLYRLGGWIRTENARVDPTSRYPTGVAAALTMESFPFTNHSPAVGGTRGWTRVEELFFATRANDRIQLRFGLNAEAEGSVWFDDLSLEEVDDISEHLPPERVRWHGPAFRYDDNGWIFVHIEGEPYTRGYQYGRLLAEEIAAYQFKLAVTEDRESPKQGWERLRLMTDALMLRGYEEEYLVEMRGIADGAAAAEAKFEGRSIDFLDVVTINSAVDLGQLPSALTRTTHPLSGRSFRADEDEAEKQERLHKCSSFLANGPATADRGIVFTQIFMWAGYTGVHWNVICDIVPSRGRRLVYETFPGGIHSGADFYINDAGIMIGETTVMQTPFNSSGTPQSSRIRKAAQYAESVDDVVAVLTTRNNGMYTNDWLIGDVRRNEIAILLLGTEKYRLWRSSKNDFPGGTTGFYWSDNNAKDPEVRKEYVPDAQNAPFDVVFSPVNRDLSFVDFYRTHKGNIDAPTAARVLATSPINRPHACDGKVTTSEMASRLVFMAHYGKVTLREKFPEKGNRRMPDLPEAVPHLTQGYTTISPVFVTERLKAARKRTDPPPGEKKLDVSAVEDVYRYHDSLLWSNTVYPGTEADNWFVSATAAYWRMLKGLPSTAQKASSTLSDQLAEISCRLSFILSREGAITPLSVTRRYDRYADYAVPRIRGTFLLHQLRLSLGNESFGRLMGDLHTRFRGKPVRTRDIRAAADKAAGRSMASLFDTWLGRSDLPSVRLTAARREVSAGWEIDLIVRQDSPPYSFRTTVAVESEKGVVWKTVTVGGMEDTLRLRVDERPDRIHFNAGNDVPLPRRDFYTFSNYFDEYAGATIVYGTGGRVEANHTMALRLQTALADAFTEVLTPVRQDAEVTEAGEGSLLLIGSARDNSRMKAVAAGHGLELGRDMFRWKGKTYARPEDGLFVAMAYPDESGKPVYLFVANSALQLYHMTRRSYSMPSWALFRNDEIVERGYHEPDGCEIGLK